MKDVPSALRAGARVAVTRPRVVGLVAVAAAGETALRIAVGLVHPVLSVLIPPLVAVPLLGAGLPSVRDVADDDGGSGEFGLDVVPTLREHAGGLLGLAVVGHAVALFAGTALFLVVDTTVRYALYWAGYGPLSMAVILGAPLPGVAIGTTLAWGTLVPAVRSVASGSDWRSAARTPLAAAAAPRQAGGVLVAHGAVGGLAAVAGLAGFVAVGPGVTGPLPALVTGVAGAGLTLAVAVCYPVVAALSGDLRSPADVPTGRLAIVALVCVALVAGASAVRVTETRPMDGAGPLPEDPSAAYAAAVENTESTSHSVRHSRNGGEAVLTQSVDRADRQYRQHSDFGAGGTTLYADPGAVYATRGGESGELELTWRTRPFALADRRDRGWVAAAYPAYWRVAGEEYEVDGNEFGLPRAGTGEWEAAAEGNGTRTLALTDGDAVFAALFETRPESVGYETAEIRMRVDTERGVVTGGRARLNATTPERDLGVDIRYEVRTGVDVETPRPPGPRTPREWLWKLFAY